MNDAELAAGLPPTASYRYADVVGDRLYVAGQVPHDATRNLIGGDSPAAQARQCLTNLSTLTQLHGFDPSDLRHMTIYVVGPHQHLLDTWEAVVEFFDGNVPPATLLGVTLLGHRNQLVEIDAHIERRRAG